MERRELLDTLMMALDTALANVHTATVARVTSVGAKTISCRPVINRVVNGEAVPLPEFVEVPPVFMGGGSSFMTWPIAVGDYCLLIFAERCFDRWYAGQDYQPPLEMRMHDYSDGFAIVGLRPESLAQTIPGTTTINGNVNMAGNLAITGDLSVSGNISAGGNVTADGTVTGTVDVVGGGVSLKTHVHTGVTPGGGNSGPPL
jgi:hypothetical protein